MSCETSGSDGLHVDLDVPLAWRPLNAAESEAVLQRAGVVLQLLNLHGESRVPAEETHGDLRHLEQKLDVVIAMLGLLLEGQAGNESPIRVRLQAGGLCWQGPDGPEPGSRILVTLRLPGAPALALPAIARKTEPGQCCVRFDSLPTPLIEQLEKWIFRQHRLAVARARAGHSR